MKKVIKKMETRTWLKKKKINLENNKNIEIKRMRTKNGLRKKMQ